MTAKATFYILKEPSLKERALYTCRVIDKLYKAGRIIYVYTSDSEQSSSMDTQLWTFSDISFVPHEIYNGEQNEDVVVLIGHDEPPASHHDVLINFAAKEIPFYKQCKHIVEVVPNEDNFKASARERFQLYHKSGFKVDVFNV